MKNTTTRITPDEALAATRRNHARADYNLWRAGLRARAASALVVGPRSGVTYRIGRGPAVRDGEIRAGAAALKLVLPFAITNSYAAFETRAERVIEKALSLVATPAARS